MGDVFSHGEKSSSGDKDFTESEGVYPRATELSSSFFRQKYTTKSMSSFHVRRTDREITDQQELQKILKTANYVTIAMCMDNEPYLVALSHGFDPAKNTLYFHCAPEGKKLVYLKANNTVWGQAILDFGVTDECDYAYSSVHFQGKLFLIEDLAEKQHALEVLVRQQSKTPEEKLAKIKPEKLAKTTMGKIEIKYMTGKKHELPKK